MKKNDQTAIYESYKEEVLNKYMEDVDVQRLAQQDPREIYHDEEVKDVEEDIPKKKVVVKSEEISVNLGPKLRSILRHLPNMSEENDILSSIKNAIQLANRELSEDDEIKNSPLNVYDKLIELGVLSEEEIDEDDFEEKDVEALQNFDDDDYREDDDDRDKEMRKDIEKGKAEEMIRRMGTDWRKHDEDFYSSNY
jgi:hypothetical protein